MQDIVIITGSLDIASTVSTKLEKGEITRKLVLLGGEMDPKQRATRPAARLEVLDNAYFTKAFLGASALSEEGPPLYATERCESNRVIIRQTEKVFLLVESAKFLKTSIYRYAMYDGFDCFITDDAHAIPQSVAEKLADG